MTLNDEQCKAILTEGLARGMYEHPSNTVPDDPKQREIDATNLVSAVEAASKNGNKSENVETILFIAKCDESPIIKSDDSTIQTVPEVELVIAPGESYNGLVLSELGDGVIDGLIIGLDKYADTEETRKDRVVYTGEKNRRINARSEAIQEIPQGEAAREIEEPSTEGNVEEVGTQQEVSNQADLAEPRPVASTDTGVGDDAGLNAGGETEADASAFARAKTPETSKEGKSNEVKSDAEDGERIEVEKQLNYDMIKAHDIDITKLGSISVAKLKYVLENPEGPPADSAPKEEQVQVEINPVPSNKEGESAVSIENNPGQQRSISKADLGIIEEDGSVGEISAEREKLESLITGPMLKAYGRGRKEIPSMGDNELRFMILNSDGKVQSEELEKARALDDVGKPHTTSDGSDDPIRASIEGSQVVVAKEVPGPEQVQETPDRTVVEAAQEAVAKAPPVQTNKERFSAQNRAIEIINKEHMPIPPEIDGEPPILPLDVSAISRDELFSLHAKFHACESRMSWITSEFEDEVNDYIKLRSNREAKVAAGIPFIGEDGKRNTNEYRDAQVKADSEVLEYGNKEHELSKELKKLKVLEKSYHLDCERLSRQMSKYERERLDGR